MALNWRQIYDEEYESQDGRFYILKGTGRLHGGDWVLYDRQDPDHYKSRYHYATLEECKAKAEEICFGKTQA